MSQLRKYMNRVNRKKKIRDITYKILYVILTPIRYLYIEYENSDLRKKRDINKCYKKLYNKIYKYLSIDDIIYLTDFYIREEHDSSNMISINDEYYLKRLTNKSSKELLDEVLLKLNQDSEINIKEADIKDIFKYNYNGYIEKEGRVFQIY